MLLRNTLLQATSLLKSTKLPYNRSSRTALSVQVLSVALVSNTRLNQSTATLTPLSLSLSGSLSPSLAAGATA